MKQILTDIVIDATPAEIWSVLLDFERYPEWNPFIQEISGEAREGGRLKVFIQPPGGRAMTFKPECLVAFPEKELRWRGKLLTRGLFDGEHRFLLEPLPDGRVRFEHGEKFTGILVPLFWKSMASSTMKGFVEMNEALKARVEALKEAT